MKRLHGQGLAKLAALACSSPLLYTVEAAASCKVGENMIIVIS
jgi:hypothetical protein